MEASGGVRYHACFPRRHWRAAIYSFHPAVAAWFAGAFPRPTPAQDCAWPALAAGADVLIAAPTGSGKTLAAFLSAIDQLVHEGVRSPLPDETRIVYVSPLKALSNDIQKNLSLPLAGIRAQLAVLGMPDVDIRAAVRSGDTTAAQRTLMRRKPPHILVTTPESLYVLLGSGSGRDMLSSCRTVIVDEIHAIAGNKRGSHLALSLERLQSLAGRKLARVGLSATQKPLETVARFLAPNGECTVIDAGHRRRRDLALELPDAPLEAVMSGEVWTQVYDRLAQLAREHRSTLIFVNTRRLAERIARHLSERLGQARIAAHHGSLSKEKRLDAEQRLKSGQLTALVATASLELGIDIGDVDLVCQIGSTRSINALLQRVGRAGHAVDGIAKGRLFPLSRDELIECAALLRCVQRGELDQLKIPANALDVLSQQIAAEVGARDWPEDALFDLVRAAYPYRDLERSDFDDCVGMLAQGFDTRRGRRSALLHHDAVNKMLRARKGTRLTALTSGGAIPDNADYRVMLEPEAMVVGTVNEDFAVESLQGDVFQLGNLSYRILRVERGTVRVEDAHGAAPSIPFWLGEAPGRTAELSAAVSDFKRDFEDRAAAGGSAAAWLTEQLGLSAAAALQTQQYLGAGLAALGCLPTQDRIVFERFFDEAGGMQLVIHSPFGSRINRAWGLSLRKRFCRNFNFELQAAASEDHIVLSLTQAHSFELADVARYISSRSARRLLIQALCAAPMFEVRWRWTAGIALALPRFRGGKKIAPQIARMNAEDLLAAVFPDQAACAENLAGELEVPDHPLVRQTIHDCLQEAMDASGFEALLERLEAGTLQVLARDVAQASPLALEALTARPYAYLDDAPLEERRTQAVMSRRWLDPAEAADIGKLDPAAIARVRAEAWPDADSPDELHDALLWLTCMTESEQHSDRRWPPMLLHLIERGRVVEVPAGAASVRLWAARERSGLFPPTENTLIDIVRGRLQGLGPVTAQQLAADVGVAAARVEIALLALESQGFAMRGCFTDSVNGEWCERRLLARIHRYTVRRLRAEIEPVAARDFLRFLCDWQHLGTVRMQGSEAVQQVLAQLEGFEAQAGAWESDILPARISAYEPSYLDEHCRAGRVMWTRLAVRAARATALRATPIVLIARRHLVSWAARTADGDETQLSTRARAVAALIAQQGASFFDEIAEGAGLLTAEAEAALAELAAAGLVNSDSFAGLRMLLMSGRRGRGGSQGAARGRRSAYFKMADAGRWALVRRLPVRAAGAGPGPANFDDAAVEQIVRTLLRRWGVIFWKLLAREAAGLPPWRDILSCCRRLEARGEIRGGRFVAGFSGEQFASIDAVAPLREARRGVPTGRFLSLSAADPLNLIGILTPGPRLPSILSNRLLYLDGLPVAVRAAGEIVFLEEADAKERWQRQIALLQRDVAPPPLEKEGAGR